MSVIDVCEFFALTHALEQMGSSDSEHLLVMAATNRPQEIDEAALRLGTFTIEFLISCWFNLNVLKLLH